MRKKIIATLVIIFAVALIYRTITANAASGANVNLYLNINNGSLDLDAGPNVYLGAWAFDPNAGTNLANNLSVINITDKRGSGAGWAVTAYGNALTATNAAPAPMKNTIANTFITIRGGALSNYNSSSETGIAVNTTNQPLNAANTIANAGAGYGSGEYYIGNSLIRATVYNNNVAGAYGSWLTLTIA